jgi:hypothetical protein
MDYWLMEISVAAIAAACGCLATAAAFNAVTGKPASIIAGNWRKYVWSILFALPAIIIFHYPAPMSLVLLALVAWLILAPSAASKYVFGPKDADWSFLIMLHSAFAFTTTTVIIVLHRYLVTD